MKIVIDRQEQLPWSFSCMTIRDRSLDTGDYTVETLENVLCVERKSIPDLVGTVVNDWQRFSRQLRRMSAMDVALIVVEGKVSDLMNHQYSSQTNPESVRGKLNRIQVQFGIQTLFLENREIAASWVENLFEKYLDQRDLPCLTKYSLT
jgi:ERCC4-type nuclease